jgi:two-component system chemotaxis sensor kinase CheA
LTSRVDLAEFLSAFVAEADEQLTIAAAKLLAVERAERVGQHDPRALRDAFRALHTVKGLSSMVGVEAIVTIAHSMESVLRSADRSGGALPVGSVEPLLQGVRAIEVRVRALEKGEATSEASPELMALLDGLASGAAPQAARERLTLDPLLEAKLDPFERALLLRPSDGRRAVQLDFAPSPDRAERGFTINSVRDRVGAVAEIIRVLPVSTIKDERAPAGFVFALLLLTSVTDGELSDAAGVEISSIHSLLPEPEPNRPDASSGAGSLAPADFEADDELPRRNVIRVSVPRVDEAMDRLGAVLVTRARLTSAVARLASAGVDTRELAQIAQENARQLRDLRSSILQVRMVSVAELLERLPFVVRALQRAGGRQARLELESGEAELDKAVADLVFPAIVHIVRNAVDHGIEMPAERELAGKPAEGVVRIKCVARSSTGVVLSVEDDGAGVDVAAVARRAGREVPTNNAALLDLLCQPGLTTRAEATTTSGRGLGMDIVRRIVVDQLGGELELYTEVGQGTTFVLHIPLTVAIIDAFVVECDSQRFVVPVSVVEEIIEIAATSVVKPPGSHGDDGGSAPRKRAKLDDIVKPFGIVQRRGEALLLFGLFRRPAEGATALFKALVVRRRGEPVGILIDRVLRQQEAVVRPIVDPLARAPGIVGATDLGDGRVTLVLDVLALTARGRHNTETVAALRLNAPASAPLERRLP